MPSGNCFLVRLAIFCCQLGLHHIAGAFFQQGLDIYAVDHIQWVQHIAFGLGHFLALLVADQAGHIDGFKGYFCFAIVIFNQVHAHHYHARYPEENNIKTSDQHIGGVEGFQALGILWPALGCQSPEGGGEPGVQYIFVLVQLGITQVVLVANFLFVAAYIGFAGLVVPGGNTVAPPQLA